MSWQELGMIALGVMISGLGWALKTLKAENDALRRDFSQLSLKVVGEYVDNERLERTRIEIRTEITDMRNDIRGMIHALGIKIDDKIDKIFDKLDAKADK